LPAGVAISIFAGVFFAFSMIHIGEGMELPTPASRNTGGTGAQGRRC